MRELELKEKKVKEIDRAAVVCMSSKRPLNVTLAGSVVQTFFALSGLLPA